MVGCEISLNLRWCKNCVLTSKATRNVLSAEGNNPAVAQINNPTNAVFNITDCKVYFLVITLSAENENKLLVQLKIGFKTTIYCNKYKCEISNQTANNNLNYLINPTYNKAHRLFILALLNEEDRS